MDEPSEVHARIIAGEARAAIRAGGRLSLAAAIGLAALSLVLKAALLGAQGFPFNADEAVVGLMARHILGGARPVFFYGQAYMGSLDAFLTAGSFLLFGEQVLSMRVVQALLYAATTASTVLLASRLLRSRIGLLSAGLLMAIPAVNVTLYTTVTLGGYGEALLIGNLLLLLALRIHDRPESGWPYLVTGFLAGLGFWGFGLILVYILPAAVLIGATLVRRLAGRAAIVRGLAVLLAAGLGAAPWLWQAVRGGLAESLRELGGSAIAGASTGGLWSVLGSHLTNLVLFGSTVVIGMRPPWGIRWLGTPSWPLVLVFWGLTGAFLLGRLRARQAGWWLLSGVIAAVLFGFVCTPFGADPSGRYFLPLAAPMALCAGGMLEHLPSRRAGAWGIGLLAVVLGFHLWGTIDSARRNPPGLTTQFDPVTWIDQSRTEALMRFLEEAGEDRGFTNYWTAYPLAFLSQERLIFIPRLPYHLDFRYTARDDRYAPYGEQVAASERVAYITTNHPALDARLQAGLSAAGISYQETWIGDYHVFYDLSRRVEPESLGLGP